MPVAAPKTEALIQFAAAQSSVLPSGLPLGPQSPMMQVTPTVQSSFFAGTSGIVLTVPVTRGLPSFGMVAPTIPMDVPSCQETK